jgi:hypothetical protein
MESKGSVLECVERERVWVKCLTDYAEHRNSACSGKHWEGTLDDHERVPGDVALRPPPDIVCFGNRSRRSGWDENHLLGIKIIAFDMGFHALAHDLQECQVLAGDARLSGCASDVVHSDREL